jgi:hypothetical protein
MSMFVSSVSFFQQDQNWFTSQANSSAQSDSTTVGRLFGSNSASTSSSSAADSLLGQFGTVIMNASTGAAVIAAQQASDRVNAQTAKLKSNAPAQSDLNVSTQVTLSGSLANNVSFGTTGPSSAGGFQFLTGSDLQAAFKSAMTALQSNGNPIDTVSVSGDTLTASTSGLNAHPVFTLSLKPDSGIYTFTLLNPVNVPTSRLDKSVTLDLSALVQAVQADGTTIALPNTAAIQVHNGKGAATQTSTGGAVYEGGLAYTGPSNTAPTTTSTTPAPYMPPTNPLTGKAYVGTAAATAATFGAVNIFT